MLYRILIYRDRQKLITDGGRRRLLIRGERVPDKGLCALASFMVVLKTNPAWYYEHDTWNFPDVQNLVPDFPGCDCREECPGEDLSEVCLHARWPWVIETVMEEYHDLAEELGLNAEEEDDDDEDQDDENDDDEDNDDEDKDGQLDDDE
jgi:hypothetical protein